MWEIRSRLICLWALSSIVLSITECSPPRNHCAIVDCRQQTTTTSPTRNSQSEPSTSNWADNCLTTELTIYRRYMSLHRTPIVLIAQHTKFIPSFISPSICLPRFSTPFYRLMELLRVEYLQCHHAGGFFLQQDTDWYDINFQHLIVSTATKKEEWRYFSKYYFFIKVDRWKFNKILISLIKMY